MNAALRKEIRLLLPAWIVALVAATVPAWIMGLDDQVCFILFAAGALLLSLSSFGLEMSLGTFPSLLAQPRPRLDIWRLKIGLLAVGLLLVVMVAAFSWWLRMRTIFAETNYTDFAVLEILWPGRVHSLLLLVVIAFAGGLWTTILIRQMAAAFWFAILVPLVLYAASLPVLKRLSEDEDTSFFMAALAVLSCVYAVTGYCLARWSFLRAQDKQAQEATGAATWSFLPAFATPHWPVMALFVKELRLQQATLSIAVALGLLHLTALAALVYLPAGMAFNYSFVHDVGMVWCVAPLLVGCASVAEERQGRTLEGALCLPVGRLRQFAIKLLVAFGLGILFGAVMPWLLEQLRPAPMMVHGMITDLGLPGLLLTATIITAIGCYVSSLSGTLLQALGAAIGLCVMAPVAFYMLTVLLATAFTWRWMDSTSDDVRVAAAKFVVCPVFSLILFDLSYANFKQLRITWRQWLRNGAVCSVVFVAALIFCFLLEGFLHWLETYLLQE
jgi:hypothetical protein